MVFIIWPAKVTKKFTNIKKNEPPNTWSNRIFIEYNVSLNGFMVFVILTSKLEKDHENIKNYINIIYKV